MKLGSQVETVWSTITLLDGQVETVGKITRAGRNIRVVRTRCPLINPGKSGLDVGVNLQLVYCWLIKFHKLWRELETKQQTNTLEARQVNFVHIRQAILTKYVKIKKQVYGPVPQIACLFSQFVVLYTSKHPPLTFHLNIQEPAITYHILPANVKSQQVRKPSTLILVVCQSDEWKENYVALPISYIESGSPP